MHKRTQMKLFHLAATALTLWLAGCATTAQPPLPAETPPAVVSAPAPAAVPAGELTPITAGEAASRGVAQMQPPPDLWDRIRRGFRMSNLESDLVRQQEQWYASRPDYMQRMTER